MIHSVQGTAGGDSGGCIGPALSRTGAGGSGKASDPTSILWCAIGKFRESLLTLLYSSQAYTQVALPAARRIRRLHSKLDSYKLFEGV